MTVGELLAALLKLVDDSATDENYWGEDFHERVTYQTPVEVFAKHYTDNFTVAACPDRDGDTGNYIPGSVKVYIEEV